MQRQTTVFWIMASVFVFSIAVGTTVVGAQTLSSPELPTPQEFFTDVTLTNQDGIEKRLYSDLLSDRTVIVSVLRSTDEKSSDDMMHRLADVQTLLGDRMGVEVSLITITLDTHSIASLKMHADDVKARQGWDIVTGDHETLSKTLRKFGQEPGNQADIDTRLLIGNVTTGDWRMASGLASAHEINAAVSSVMPIVLGNVSLNME